MHSTQKLFCKIPTALLLDPEITRSTLILIAVMIDLQDVNGCVDQTIGDLMRYTGLSDKTVRRGLREMYNKSIIDRVDRTGRGSMYWMADAYRTNRDYSAIIATLRARRARA